MFFFKVPQSGMGTAQVPNPDALDKDGIVGPAGQVDIEPAPEIGKVEAAQVEGSLADQTAECADAAADCGRGTHQRLFPQGRGRMQRYRLELPRTIIAIARNTGARSRTVPVPALL